MTSNIAQQTQDALRLKKALSLRVRGAHWNEIADACGYPSPAAALKDVGKAMAQATQAAQESAQSLRDTANLQLDVLLREAWQMIEAQQVMDEHGNVTDDRAVRLRAVDEARRIVGDKLKLNGVSTKQDPENEKDRIIIIGLDPDETI